MRKLDFFIRVQNSLHRQNNEKFPDGIVQGINQRNAVVSVTKNPVATSFSDWAKPGHFSRKLAKGPKSTTWIWNLHADAHDFDCQTRSLEKLSRRIFSAHFGQLSLILLWISGMWFHGARFSNYLIWLTNPTTIKPSSQFVWPIVGQEILNGDLGGGFCGVRITSGWFQLWRACGITNEAELYWTSMGGLVLSATMMLAGWYHYHESAPDLDWFQNAESMMNHHLAGLLGLGCLSWSGHQIHVSLPINKLLDAGVEANVIPLPHKLLFDQAKMAKLYPSFKEGLTPFFTLDWAKYDDFLTFRGGVNPVTGSLWLSDVAHHHLALSVLFIVAGHMYRTNWGIGHSMREILEAHKGPFTGEGHKGLYEILTHSWHAQLAINLAMLGSTSIVVAHHMYAMPPYPYIGVDYPTQLSLFTHHMWIGGFCIVGGGAHAAIYIVREYSPVIAYNNLLDRVLRHRDSIISHLNWVSIFLGTHSFGLYIHNDTMQALGRPYDEFGDRAIQLQPIFAKWIQAIHTSNVHSFNPRACGDAPITASYAFGGAVVAVNGKISTMPIFLGTSDFLVHHIHAFNIHVATLILLKGVLFGRSSRLIPDKARLGFRFPCDGPGRGGTCQVSAWDHVFLGLFWMYNCISITIFHFSWKMQSDVWGSVTSSGTVTHITSGNFSSSSSTINGWLRDFLWAQSSQVIQSYGTPTSAYGLIFLAGHFTWAFSLMFLFSGRGFWQELIESVLWAHRKLSLNPAISPRALSITTGRGVGLAHYLLGGIGVTWAFFLARVTNV
jgi:photosystem I P700 chlorophyll a apoprotein A1